MSAAERLLKGDWLFIACCATLAFLMPEPTSEILREPLLDAEQTAVLLGIPRSSVYDYARRGELPHVRVGRHVKFIRRDLEQVLRERRAGI